MGSNEKTLEIGNFFKQMAKEYPQIERVILFGSRARGDSGVQADFDVAVQASGMSDAQWAKFNLDTHDRFPSLSHLDLVRLTPQTDSSLRKNVETQGKLLYERAA